MRIKVEQGALILNMGSLMDALDEEAKNEMIEHLACDSEIIKRVTQQILDRWTESGSHGYAYCTATELPAAGLDWAWREVARRSDEVASREIKRLEDALSRSEKNYRALLDKTYRQRLDNV